MWNMSLFLNKKEHDFLLQEICIHTMEDTELILEDGVRSPAACEQLNSMESSRLVYL